MSLYDAHSHLIISFGKYKGESFEYVYEHWKQYVGWVVRLSNPKGQMLTFQQYCNERLDLGKKKEIPKRRKFIFVELPNDAFEVSKYKGHRFDRYWWDAKNVRLIMKTVTGRYKVVQPMEDIRHDHRHVSLYNVDGELVSIDYDKLVWSYSIGFWLWLR